MPGKNDVTDCHIFVKESQVAKLDLCKWVLVFKLESYEAGCDTGMHSYRQMHVESVSEITSGTRL